MMGFLALAGCLYLGALTFMKWQYSPKDQLRPPTRESSGRRKASTSTGGVGDVVHEKIDKMSKWWKRKNMKSPAEKHGSAEWASLPRDMAGCLTSQEELMTTPVPWPGFHALCIDAAPSAAFVAENEGGGSVSVLLHRNSGVAFAERPPEGKPRPLSASADSNSYDATVEALIQALKEELLPTEFDPRIDPMISNSAYDFVPNPWRLFTSRGEPVETDADLADLGKGASLYLYTGGQFIWPGVRLGHKTQVPIPVADGTPGGYKLVEMETLSLRPVVMGLSGMRGPRAAPPTLLSPPIRSFSPPPHPPLPPPCPPPGAGFLSDEECAFIKKYASTRMVPSGLAMMDSSGDSRDVRTSTQTFMTRNGSPQIRALEERAHNLTRLPYELGENIQVVRYEKGQKYGAHRDFFNPNDYHKQPAMLRNVEYGARNRMATVFWYLETVKEGGETFFPRALNADGREYHPWNGDHEDCYRGLYVPPVRGNAVLFYSMVPDGRLDERALHGGCKPRVEGHEKWGANQWIWNHPERHSGVAPRKGAAGSRHAQAKGGRAGCVDSEENCPAWADGGECEKSATAASRTPKSPHTIASVL